MKINLIYIFILIGFLGCTETDPLNNDRLFNKGEANKIIKNIERIQLMPRDFVSWVRNRDNNLLQTIKHDKIEFSLQYKPKDYVACLEMKKNSLSAKELSEITSELGEYLYFDFTINILNYNNEFLKYNLIDDNQYQEKVKYCAFEMKKDIKLINGNDTLSCVLFHFERAFNIVSQGTFLLAFENLKNKNERVSFVYFDKLFNSGSIKFDFESGCFTKIPQLKTL